MTFRRRDKGVQLARPVTLSTLYIRLEECLEDASTGERSNGIQRLQVCHAEGNECWPGYLPYQFTERLYDPAKCGRRWETQKYALVLQVRAMLARMKRYAQMT